MMIKRFFTFILIISMFLSCAKYEVKDSMIDASTLTIDNIKTDLPIINIIVNQNDFDYMYRYYNSDIEIDAVFEMYVNKSKVLTENDVTINVKGSFSASLPLKSLGVKFDDPVANNNSIIINNTSLLANHSLNEIRKISLRNSGNDCGETFIKDISYTQMAIDLNLDLELSYYRPAEVFVNNKYYGLLNIRTDKGKNGLYKLLNVDKDDLNIIKISSFGDKDDEIEFKDGDETILQSLVDAVNAENTSVLKEKIDISSFVDYFVYEDIIGNTDWVTNNVEFYSVGNGKFRFFLFDLDKAGNSEKFFALKEFDSGFIYKMYKTLNKDPEVKALLCKRQREIIENYTYEHFYYIVNNNANIIENDIIYNISKYGLIENRVQWYRNIQKILDSFKLRKTNYIKFYKL